VIENKLGHVHRVENPIEVEPLSALLLERDKISLSLATDERSHFGRIGPLSVPESANLKANLVKKPRIDPAKGTDSEINLNYFEKSTAGPWIV
jgi:hypothetical protein